MYANLKRRYTSFGFSFDQAIQQGVDNPGNPCQEKHPGMVAGDEESYEVR